MQNKAFTLVELVIVVLILGILAAIAAPKILVGSHEATDASIKQTLEVIRDAIAMYAATNGGAFPPDQNATKFRGAIAPYLRGPFPDCLVGADPDRVEVSGDDPLIPDDSGGWMYNGTTGEFIINCTDLSSDGVTPYSDF